MHGRFGDRVDTAFAARPVLSAPQQIAYAIEDLILDGTLRAGDRLPRIDGVAARFGVSIPTAQQGLKALAAAGVLDVARGRGGGYRVGADAIDAIGRVRGGGVFGRPPVEPVAPAEGYRQLLQVREVQDVLAAQVAAAERSPGDLSVLEELLSMELPADAERAFDLDLDIHRALALATHNPLIVGFTTSTTLALRRFTRATDRVGAADVVFALDAVVGAIRRRDPAGAATAMRTHLRRSGDFFGRPRASGVPAGADA